MNVLRGTMMLGLLCAGLAAAARGGDLAVDDLMLQDPSLSVPAPITVFSPRLKSLWLAALARPDAETRRLAAGTISIAIQRGMKDLESSIEPLRDVLRSDSDPVVRRAAAQALVALQARDAAPDLAAAAQKDGLLMALVAEPALAAWDYEPYRVHWLARCDDPATPRAMRELALDGLGTVRESKAVERLEVLVRQKSLDPQPRLAAARALGKIRDQDLAELASEISANGRSSLVLARLLAAMLLARQSDAKAVELLKILAVDVEPSVAKLAIERLHAVDAAVARPLATQALQSPDAALRGAAAPMIVACNDAEAIRVLRPLLADRNPSLRRYVAAQFVEFARREELKPVVLEESMAMLADTPWRGIEQAALLLGTLDHKPAASRLLELLPHDRPEVMATAAWALRRLRIPETLPAALKRALLVADKHLSGPPHFHEQLSQLQQMFGDLRYREAEPLLRRFIPKSQLPNNVRMSAVWSLGLLYEKQPDNDLVKLFVERLTDVNSSPSESVLVRQMTAVGLGRMQAKSELPVLRKMAAIDSSNGTAGAASYWAIEQMTGEKPPVAQAPVVGVSGWFLEPTVD